MYSTVSCWVLRASIERDYALLSVRTLNCKGQNKIIQLQQKGNELVQWNSRLSTEGSRCSSSIIKNLSLKNFFSFRCGQFLVFIEFVTIPLMFYVLFFWLPGMWNLSSPTRDRTHNPTVLEGIVLTTGPPGSPGGKSQESLSLSSTCLPVGFILRWWQRWQPQLQPHTPPIKQWEWTFPFLDSTSNFWNSL